MNLSNYAARRDTIVVGALVLFFIIITRFVGVANTPLLWLTDAAWTLGAGAVAWKSWQTAHKMRGIAKEAWQFFAYAHISWFAGILIWDYLELIEQVVTPFPALSDLGFMLFAPLFMYALVRVRYQSGGLSNTLIQISKLGVFSVSVVTVHIIVLSPLISSSNESALYISLALVYPVLYISAFVYSLLNLWQCKIVRQRKVISLIVASIFFHSLAVSVYSYSLLGKTYEAGNYIDVFWLFAFALMYLAASYQQELVATDEVVTDYKGGVHKLTDALLIPVSMVLLLVARYVFKDGITPEISTLILGFLAALIFFYIIKELASYKLEEMLTRELAESEERFRDISFNLPGIVYQFCVRADGTRDFPFVSPGIYELAGVKDTDVMKNADVWFSRVHPEDMQSLEQSILLSFTTLKPWVWSGRMKNASGATGWFEGTSIPKRKDNGDVIWNGIILDATAKHAAEMALITAYDEMENRVEERTRELIVEKENAEKASAAKSQFLSHMSHELRTPLNAVIGFSQLLQMGQLNATQNDSVNEIVMAGQHLLELVNDLLDLEKIESGKMTIVQEAVDLGSMLDDLITFIKPIADIKQIKVSNACSDESAVVLADNFRLRQTILNLLSNAIKYNRDNGSVQISCERLNGRIKIKVADTGYGIRQEHMHKLFEPFDRLGAEAGTVEGSGVGLTISKRLVELMSGTIGVESEYEKGSVFWISLPEYKEK